MIYDINDIRNVRRLTTYDINDKRAEQVVRIANHFLATFAAIRVAVSVAASGEQLPTPPEPRSGGRSSVRDLASADRPSVLRERPQVRFFQGGLVEMHEIAHRIPHRPNAQHFAENRRGVSR